MKFTPGIWNIPKKEDWIYLIKLLGFDRRFESFWDEYNKDFCARITLIDNKYDFGYGNIDWYLNNNFVVIGVYTRNEYQVDLI